MLECLDQLEVILKETKSAFDNGSFEEIGVVLSKKEGILKMVSDKIKTQVGRTRTEESSPKNTTLYFSLLLETKDLIKAIINILELYHSEHDSSVAPATIDISKQE